MTTTTEQSQCDACGRTVGETETATYYGIEGDFCHQCRHGRECDCEEGEQL